MEGTSIAVLCMNKPGTLAQTVANLEHTLEQPYEVILVDNGSTDPQTRNILATQERKGWKVIRNESNRGLSVGTNQGLEAGQYDFLIHLDDDCLVKTKGWNQIMRRYIVNHPEVGMVAPSRQAESIDHGPYQEIRWAMGFIWGIRKSLFDKIGGYDPQLHHQNECDMALRVRMSGFRLAGIADFTAIHNDPGGPRSDIALAREHIGCVQFRDKWATYFRGEGWNYGTPPIYLMQHWPPDQDFFRRFSEHHGVDLNPPPDEVVPGGPQEVWDQLDHFAARQIITIAGQRYLIWRDIRNDYCHWEHRFNPDGYVNDRIKAINRWHELTGELYEGYQWPNLLKPV